MPRISVIMPVYNCAPYLREAINSVLGQSFSDLELLIIDDASSDETVDIIKEFEDIRIRLIQKPINTGYTESLNLGLKIARGELIARMDGDDISDLSRFALQIKEFDGNPDLKLCGSWIKIIDNGCVFQFPTLHDAIKVEFLEYCCIAHPSVMFRRMFMEQNKLSYDKTYEPAEDFDLWTRMIKLGTFINIPKVLLYYREYQSQTSQVKQNIRIKNAKVIKIRHLSEIVSNAAASRFYNIDYVINSKSITKEIAFLKWLKKETQYLKKRNQGIQYFNSVILNEFLENHLRNNIRIVFLHSKKYQPLKIYSFLRYISAYPRMFTKLEIVKSICKCVCFYSIR